MKRSEEVSTHPTEPAFRDLHNKTKKDMNNLLSYDTWIILDQNGLPAASRGLPAEADHGGRYDRSKAFEEDGSRARGGDVPLGGRRYSQKPKQPAMALLSWHNHSPRCERTRSSVALCRVQRTKEKDR